MDTLSKAGYEQEQYMKPPELKTITDITKILGKKKFEELLNPYLEKPQGKPTLAPVSDKRPEFIPGDDDFTDLDKGEM
jgi:hypothetical protein